MKTRVLLYLVLAIVAFPRTHLAQVSFSEIPYNMQMFPRGANNTGTFSVKGICSAPAAVAMRSELVEKDKDGSLRGKIVESIDYELAGDGHFRIIHHVPARLSEFTLRIYELNAGGAAQLVHQVDDLVAGDFYLIAGQSNAEAYAEGDLADLHDSLYSHPACRGIGAAFHFATSPDPHTGIPRMSVSEDSRIGRPTCVPFGRNGYGFVNVWGLKLQHRLAVQSGVPSCFINAAKGGASILECLPSKIPSDTSHLLHSPDSLHQALMYDRALKKIVSNNAAHGVRAVFWYQGETDGTYGEDSASSYDEKFKILYEAWASDFPSLEKVFVLQVSMGCGGENLRLVAELQRQLPKECGKVVVMSTVGFNVADRRNDFCHYTFSGWNKLSDNLFPLVHEALYGQQKNLLPYLPANALRAYYKSPNHLCIEFSKEVIVDHQTEYPLPDSGVVYAADNFFDEKNEQVAVKQIQTEGNEMQLFLDELQEPVSSITFLPGSYTKIPTLYAGPWIRNKDNPDIGASVFYRLPVASQLFRDKPAGNMEEIRVGPVPANSYCRLEMGELKTDKIIMYDMYGAEITEIQPAGDRHVIIDLTGTEPGIYYLWLADQNRYVKLIKL